MLQGNIEAPTQEAATPEELREAAFCVLKEAHAGTRPPGVYHERYITWLMCGLPSWEAYLERAGIYLKAHCYLQVPRAAGARPPPTSAFFPLLPSSFFFPYLPSAFFPPLPSSSPLPCQVTR